METPNWATGVAGTVTSEGFTVDLHVKVLDEQVVQRAKARGLDALVYAPHFTRLPDIRERAERFSDEELSVYPGRELFTGTWQRRRHILAVGLSEMVPDFLTLDGTMAELRRQDAAVLVPHPGFLNVSLGREEIARYRDTIDAIEVYNPKHREYQNERAQRIARETGLPGFGSSYAHLHGTVGGGWTEVEGRLDGPESVIEAFRDEEPRRVFHRDGYGHALRRHLEYAHLGYENTWKKIDRLFLSGTEPTHPKNVAYDGRFDDVSVY